MCGSVRHRGAETTLPATCCAVSSWTASRKHSYHHPTTVLSGSRSEWFLAVPSSENGPQGNAFCNHGRHQIEYDGRTLEDSKRSLPPLLPTMAGSMEQVCVCAKVVLWSWLSKRCHMSYPYSAIPHFRELFDCPSYDSFNRTNKIWSYGYGSKVRGLWQHVLTADLQQAL